MNAGSNTQSAGVIKRPYLKSGSGTGGMGSKMRVQGHSINSGKNSNSNNFENQNKPITPKADKNGAKPGTISHGHDRMQ